MINYESNDVLQMFRWRGSNIPRAMLFASPSVMLAVLSHYMLKEFSDDLSFVEKINASSMWSASVVVLGVLLGMRTSKAYGRFWEGITLVQHMRAEWFESASNLVAFSLVSVKKDEEKFKERVNLFQYTLVRLMSLMHGAALRQIGGHEEEFQVLDIKALDQSSLNYLSKCEASHVNPVEVLLQWVQVAVTDAQSDGTIAVPAPILTRVYQTLSRGMVNLHDARKLAECPFPFPLTQMVFALLMLQSIFAPIYIATTVDHPVIAAIMTFVPIFGMFSITFTAGELEQPFGNDPNDLPLSGLQMDYNKSLLMLLDPETGKAPTLNQEAIRTVDQLRMKYKQSRNSSMTNSLHRPWTASLLFDDGEGMYIQPSNTHTSSNTNSYSVVSPSVGLSQPLRPHTESDPRLGQQDKLNGGPAPDVNVVIKEKDSSLQPEAEDLSQSSTGKALESCPSAPERTSPAAEKPLENCPIDPARNIEKQLANTLAEECVSALTFAFSELLQHSDFFSFAADAGVIRKGMLQNSYTASAGAGVIRKGMLQDSYVASDDTRVIFKGMLQDSRESSYTVYTVQESKDSQVHAGHGPWQRFHDQGDEKPKRYVALGEETCVWPLEATRIGSTTCPASTTPRSMHLTPPAKPRSAAPPRSAPPKAYGPVPDPSSMVSKPVALPPPSGARQQGNRSKDVQGSKVQRSGYQEKEGANQNSGNPEPAPYVQEMWQKARLAKLAQPEEDVEGSTVQRNGSQNSDTQETAYYVF